ncbi:MAG: Ig-like domain-containing protein, partial [Limnospira sp. PMC 894.15]|uniref:Ig-like domain-containing protein n=1 Tax=Limnospira sp. PMC 894.15 TaxID=2981100 RepID=UPI0028E141EB
EIFLDGDSIGTATADGDGNWTFTSSEELSAGILTATATDAAGNISEASDGFTLDEPVDDDDEPVDDDDEPVDDDDEPVDDDEPA